MRNAFVTYAVQRVAHLHRVRRWNLKILGTRGLVMRVACSSHTTDGDAGKLAGGVVDVSTPCKSYHYPVYRASLTLRGRDGITTRLYKYLSIITLIGFTISDTINVSFSIQIDLPGCFPCSTFLTVLLFSDRVLLRYPALTVLLEYWRRKQDNGRRGNILAQRLSFDIPGFYIDYSRFWSTGCLGRRLSP